MAVLPINELKKKIDDNIYQNNQQAITGARMKTILNDMVDSLDETATLDTLSRDLNNAKQGVQTNAGNIAANKEETDTKLTELEQEVVAISDEIFVEPEEYKDTIAEMYIIAPLVSGESLLVKAFDSKLYIRCGNTNSGISSLAWQSQFQLTGKVNGIVYEVVCTTGSESLGVNAGDLVGYIVLKDIDTLLSMSDTRSGHSVFIKKCTDINFSPIIFSTKQNTEPTIQDRSISAIMLQNYGKLPRITTSITTDMNSVVAEIYIIPEFCDDSLKYTIKPFNRGFVFGAYTSNYSRRWASRNYNIDELYQNNEIIPLVVNLTDSDMVVGTLVGYLILKDIDTLVQMPDNTLHGETVDLGIASQLFLNLKIATFLNQSYIKQPKLLIDGVDITLPDEIIAVEGDTLQIFWRSVIGAFNPYIFDVLAVCSVGKSYPRYYTFTPTTSNVGNEYTLQVLVKGNDGDVIVERSVKIKVVAKMTSPSSTKNILCIGASATAGGQWVGELDRRLTAISGNGTTANPTGLGLTNIYFVGRKQGTSNPVNLEATGGWRVQDYASAGRRAVRFYVTGADTIALGANYSNNGTIYVVQEVNITEGVGNIRCTLENTFVSPSSPYTLTKVSGSGDDEITFTSYEEETYSPFWNESTNELDFVTYANAYCDGQIDYLIWHCGVNDLTSGDPSVIPSVISSFRKLLDAYHEQFPNGKVIISSIPIGSINGGFAANYGASANLNYFKFAKVVQKYAQALNDLCNEDVYTSFVEYSPALEEFDAENSYPTTQTPVNNRSSVTEELGTNGVHPIAVGSYMIADTIYRTMNAITT